MEKKKKRIRNIAIIIGMIPILYALQIVLGGLFIGGFFFPRLNYEKTEKIFAKDYELLLVAAKYLENSNYDNIYIPDLESWAKYANKGETEIENIKANKAIKVLKRKGYSIIGKENNTIYFQRWANLKYGRGIAYSIDGKEPILEYLIKAEPLSISNWYYYEEE